MNTAGQHTPAAKAPGDQTTRVGEQASRWRRRLLALVALLCIPLAGSVAWLNLRGDAQGASITLLLPGTAHSPVLIEKGRELAQIGHCAGCHTAPGGTPYAGGSALQTPFGTVYGGNLTPDPDTGLGRWTSQDFWRAMHNGRSRDGRLLNPAFPYENFSLIRREDSDALYAYLQSLPAVRQAQRPAELRFPANMQLGLAVWRALHFHPSEPLAPHAMPRGEYLTRGLAHCAACHGERSTLGALKANHNFSGQLMAGGRAHAPPLPPPGRTDTGPWTIDDLVAYLKTGHSRQGAALGLMAEVVVGSTQHIDTVVLQEMAAWLLSQPLPAPVKATITAPKPQAARADLGARVYEENCAQCHGEQGQGAAGIYPPLAGNPRVSRDPATNLIRIIHEGGFGPSTAGHPQPFGMPPFGHLLQPDEVAAVATHVRRQFNGPALSEVTPLEVLKHR